MNQFLAKIKDFCVKNEHKIVLVIAFCLISATSYEFGILQGQKWQQKPLVIEKPSVAPVEGQSAQNEPPDTLGSKTTVNLASQAKSSPPAGGLSPNSSNCAYVGSKSSNKFYLPTCSYAKRVKPENLVCFKSAQEAIGQGRTESKCK